MQVYVLAYKEEILDVFDKEHNARTDYRLSNVSLGPDLHLFSGTLTDLVELPKDYSVPLEVKEEKEIVNV
jgi:hypothetical protein